MYCRMAAAKVSIVPQLSSRRARRSGGYPPEDEAVQLQVFTDGGNDGAPYTSGLYWATSVKHSEDKEPGTWHYIEVT